MNRHERCLAAIGLKPADRMPTYCPAISCEVASEILGRQAYAGTTSLQWAEVLAWSRGEQAHADFEAQLLQDLLDLSRALDIDAMRMPWRFNAAPTKAIDDHTFIFGDPEGAHRVYKYEPTSGEFAAVARIGYPPIEPEDRLRQQVDDMERQEQRLLAQARASVKDEVKFWQRFGAEFFTLVGGGGISVGIAEDDLMALALAPDLMARKVMMQAKAGVAFGQALATSPCPKVTLGGGDLAGTTGLMYSPQAFHDVVLPAYRHLVHHLNRLGVHYMFRTDGHIWPIADMLFVDAACPGYGEADRDAGMSIAALRRRYPKLVIWGNVSSNFLQRATPQQVRDEAARHIDEAEGRGFFQGCSNAIVRGTPAANVAALFSVR